MTLRTSLSKSSCEIFNSFRCILLTKYECKKKKEKRIPKEGVDITMCNKTIAALKGDEKDQNITSKERSQTKTDEVLRSMVYICLGSIHTITPITR